MRLVVAMLGAAVFGLSGCDKPKERTRNDVAIAAAIEQAQREDAEADRHMRERAAQQEQERREAEQAAIDTRVAEEEARRATQTRFEQQVRATLIDPSSLQIRNQRLTADGTALCAEASAEQAWSLRRISSRHRHRQRRQLRPGSGRQRPPARASLRRDLQAHRLLLTVF
jgi:hypothetical protein